MRFLKIIFLLFTSFLLCLTTKAKEISVGHINWEPFYSNKLPQGGPFGEIAIEALQRAGYTPKLQFLPWSRLLKKTADGEIDLLLGVYYSDKRTRIYTFSDTIGYIKVNLIAHAHLNIKRYHSLKDLSPYTIGINQDWVNSPEFDAAYYLKTDPANNQTLTLRKLLHNRVDMIVASPEVFKYEIAKTQAKISAFTFLEPPLSLTPLHLSYGKNNPQHKQLIEDFNKAFQSMKKDGSYSEILKRHHLESVSVFELPAAKK